MTRRRKARKSRCYVSQQSGTSAELWRESQSVACSTCGPSVFPRDVAGGFCGLDGLRDAIWAVPVRRHIVSLFGFHFHLSFFKDSNRRIQCVQIIGQPLDHLSEMLQVDVLQLGGQRGSTFLRARIATAVRVWVQCRELPDIAVKAFLIGGGG